MQRAAQPAAQPAAHREAAQASALQPQAAAAAAAGGAAQAAPLQAAQPAHRGAALAAPLQAAQPAGKVWFTGLMNVQIYVLREVRGLKSKCKVYKGTLVRLALARDKTGLSHDSSPHSHNSYAATLFWNLQHAPFALPFSISPCFDVCPYKQHGNAPCRGYTIQD